MTGQTLEAAWAVQDTLIQQREEALAELAAARAEVERWQAATDEESAVLKRVLEEDRLLRALLGECRDHIQAAGHLSPRCEYFGECRCDRDDLLQRIEAALGEGGV